MLYRNIRELPIHNFNEVELTEDYTYLIKDNTEHTEDDLIKHWGLLYDAYMECIGDKAQINFYADKMSLHKLEIKLQLVINLSILYDCYDRLSAEERKQLDGIKSSLRIGKISSAIEFYKAKIDKLINDFKDKYKTEYNSKDRGIDEIIPYLLSEGYHINRHTTTVSEWCGIMKNLRKQNEKQEAKKLLK